MFYPKVKFEKAPFGLELNLLCNFLFFRKWGWEKNIIRKHSGLKGIYKIKTAKERRAFLKKYIREFYKIHRFEIENRIKKYGRKWASVEKRYFIALPEILETSWPSRRKNITAFISLNPICPRFLDDWDFLLFYGFKDKEMLETSMHEICHFLYFKKWKEVFPASKRRTYDHPYIEWHLSEILAGVILNDSRLKKILGTKGEFYPVHEKLKIGRLSAPEYFTQIYKQHLKRKSSFEEFLKEAYEEIKKNRKIFEALNKK